MEKTKTETLKGRRGMLDIFYILAFLFVIGIIIIVVFLMLNKIDDSGIYDKYTDAKNAHKQGERTILGFDTMMLMIIMGLSLFVILSAAFVWNHPVFVILGLIALTIAITVAGVVSNAWFDFSTHSQISSTVSSFPKLNFLLKQLPFYIMFMGIAGSISASIGYRRFN